MAKDLTGMPEDVTIRGDNAVDGGRTITIGRKDVSGREDPVNVDTLRSKFTIDSESLSYASSRTYNLLDYGAISDDSTDIKASIDAAKTAIGANEAILDVRDIGSTYYLAQSVTLPKNITLRIHRGAKIRILSGQVLTVNGAVEAGNYEIFSCDPGGVLIREDGTDETWTDFDTSAFPKTDFFSHRQHRMNALWFSGADIGEKCNKAFAAGKHDSSVFIPAGFYVLSTEIDMHEDVGSHLTLAGESFIGTTLVIPNSAYIVGINCGNSDEANVRDLRVIERTGTRVSCCIKVGGTSFKCSNVWVGNAKYGFFSHGGRGTLIYDSFAEHCDYNLFIATRFNDSTISGLTGSTITTGLQASNCLIHSAEVTNVHVQNYILIVVTTTTGTFAVGDTVTASSSGDFTILDIDSETDTWTIDRSVIPSVSETLTGPSGTGTITDRSGNLLANNKLQNLRFQGIVTDPAGKGIVAIDTQGTDIADCMFENVVETGVYLKNCEGFRLSGTSDRTVGLFAEIEDSNGVVSGLSTLNASGSSQKRDIAVTGGVVRIDGCSLRSEQPLIMASADPHVTGYPFSDGMQFDGVDDSVSIGNTIDYSTQDSVTIEFTLHARGTTSPQFLLSWGTDNSNGFGITTIQGVPRFILEKSGNFREAIGTKWKLGNWSVVFDVLNHTILVTDPDGLTIEDTVGVGAIALIQDGDFWIGQRAVTPSTFYFDGVLSNVRVYDDTATPAHQWYGYGNTPNAWADHVGGSDDGVVSGSPAITKVCPTVAPAAVMLAGDRLQDLGAVTGATAITLDNYDDQAIEATLTGDATLTLACSTRGSYRLLLRSSVDATARTITVANANITTGFPASVSSGKGVLVDLVYDGNNFIVKQ